MHREYDTDLQIRYDFRNHRYPTKALSEKELFDLNLWKTIRFYEKMGKLRNELIRLETNKME